nr:hypothetical protein [Tanacetum cinerariifolium]
KAIHGPVLAEAVLATAADGYQAVFALPEIDADFSPQTILLADQRDGQPLPAHDGPYQLVVPLEKKPTRWVRQLTGLKGYPAVGGAVVFRRYRELEGRAGHHAQFRV